MKTKRSMWMALLCAAGAGLLVTNCTVKSDDGCDPGEKRTGCVCEGDKSEGYQVCSSEGVYGGCECSPQNVAGGSNAGGGGSNAGGGGASAGETSVAGQGGALGEAGEGGVGGEAGVGGEGGAPAEDCVTCLSDLCGPEFDECALEDENSALTPGEYCLSSKIDGSGQIEKILSCIDELRKTGVAKREAVRSCGASLGSSSSPTFSDWPPPTMTPATEQVMNCMADAPTEANPGAWAGDDVVSTPWVDGTCAKLACTSAQLAQ
jgi:hypothetical protein